MDQSIQKLVRIIQESSNIAGFTGAGVSTESGISDYRSKGGIWDRFQPIYFEEFLGDEEKRKLYWRRRLETWPGIRDAKTNAGHHFFKKLYDTGKLTGLITQNIDGLHEKSGIPEDKIVRLHGTALEIVCLDCGRVIPAEPFMKTLTPESSPPRCSECGGLLKPNTISFGQNLVQAEIRRAEDMAARCDCMLCLGSTLVVYPAAVIPAAAKRRGAALAIITLSETPLDDEVDVVIHRPIGEVVAELQRELT